MPSAKATPSSTSMASGYEVQLSARTLRNLKFGDEVTLTIDTHVREDAIRLFSFQSEGQAQLVSDAAERAGRDRVEGGYSACYGVLSTQDLANAIALGNWAAVRAGTGRRQEARNASRLNSRTRRRRCRQPGSTCRRWRRVALLTICRPQASPRLRRSRR